MSRVMRLALIGCGDAASGYLAARPHLQRAVFAAAVDPDLTRASVAARALDASISTDSFDDLLAQNSDAFDAVLINWSGTTRAGLLEKAAEAGKHVLVETPLALSTDGADAAIEACRSAGVCLMVGQALRFMASVQKVRDSLASGKLGTLGLLRVHRWETLGTGPERGDGTVLGQVIREIDLANWLFGRPPTEVYAVGRGQSNADLDGPGYVQVHLGFPDGGMAMIDYSMTLPQGAGYFSLSLIGSTGAAYADDHHNMNLLYRGGVPFALNPGQGQGHALAQLQEFVDAVQEEREPAVTGTDGRAAIQVAQAAVESMTSERVARLAGGRYEVT